MIDIAVPVQHRPASPFLAELRRALGPDWTWTIDPDRRLCVVEHARGLRFEVAIQGGFEASSPEQNAREIATALLDAVEDGVKGLVVVQVQKQVTPVPPVVTYSFTVRPIGGR